MIRLSIIIPFYNVEQYIAQCLDSVYHQNILEDEYEVICVNDASLDNSRDIVLEYQKVHKNLILVEHKHNKKLGAARNTGRSIARGKYIWNVDSDDYITRNCLSSILELCDKNDLDILMFNIASNKENIIQRSEFSFEYEGIQEGLICLDQNRYKIGQFCPVWRYVYSKAFLDKNDIYSPEINMGEDVPYAFKALLLAKRVLLVNEIYYNYRINPNSLTGVRQLGPNVLYEKCFVAARKVYDLLKYIPRQYYGLEREFKNMIRYIIYMYPEYYVKMSKDEKKKFVHICRNNIFKDYCLFYLMNRYMKKRYLKKMLNL